MKNKWFLIFFLFSASLMSAQNGFEFVDDVKKVRIPFEQDANLIIVPVTVNKVPMKFILDSGATKNIIFNLKGIDSLDVKAGKFLDINGYGEKEGVRAYQSLGNTITVDNLVVDNDVEILILSNGDIDLLPKLNVEIHGLLGVDFFKNFVTYLDYEKSYIRLYKDSKDLPRYLRKAKAYPLTIKNKRAHIQVDIMGQQKMVNNYDILLDTGSGDALWIINKDADVEKIKGSFEDYLGYGIKGEIHGIRSKVKSVQVFDYLLRKVTVSYPYEKYFSSRNGILRKEGSLGGEVLRRFDVVIDYSNEELKLIPNDYFNDGFYYNMTGLGVKKGAMELFTFVNRDFVKNTNGSQLKSSSSVTISSSAVVTYQFVPKIIVDYVRENSPAEKAGILKGDEIVEINNVKRKSLSYGRVTNFFYNNPYKKLKIKLKRNNKFYKVELVNLPLIFSSID